MPYYESVVIARQEMSGTQVEGLADQLAQIVTDRGGQVLKREMWGLKNLAYRIAKNRKGHYVMFHFDAPWPAIEEMERQMHLSEDVLRYMTLKVDEVEEGPSAMMQARNARDDRPRRGDRDGFRGDGGRDGGPRDGGPREGGPRGEGARGEGGPREGFRGERRRDEGEDTGMMDRG